MLMRLNTPEGWARVKERCEEGVGGGTTANLPHDIVPIGPGDRRRSLAAFAARQCLLKSLEEKFRKPAGRNGRGLPVANYAAFLAPVGTSEIVFRICEAIA